MTSITDDILTWSEKYLEPKNKHLGDVPVRLHANKLDKDKHLGVRMPQLAEFQDKIIEGARLTKDSAVQITIVGCDDIGYTPEEIDLL